MLPVTWRKEEGEKSEEVIEVEEGDWEARKIDDYVVIGMCAGILALIYVLAVIVFVTVRKGRWRQTRRRSKSAANGTGRQMFQLECERPARPVIPRPFLIQVSPARPVIPRPFLIQVRSFSWNLYFPFVSGSRIALHFFFKFRSRSFHYLASLRSHLSIEPSNVVAVELSQAFAFVSRFLWLEGTVGMMDCAILLESTRCVREGETLVSGTRRSPGRR